MTKPSTEARLAGALDRAMTRVERMQTALGAALMLPKQATEIAGSEPGIEHEPETRVRPKDGEVEVRCVDYGAGRTESLAFDDIEALIAAPSRPDWASVRWVRIDGVHPYTINEVREAFGLHSLAAEDIAHSRQRPRVEAFGDDLFVVAQVLGIAERGIEARQLSAFVQPGLIITSLEAGPDVFAPVVSRLETNGSRLQSHGPDFLLYALLDTVGDSCFPALERFSEELEGLESLMMSASDRDQLLRVQTIKHELAAVRRVAWPTRELVHALGRDDTPVVTAFTRTYLRDVRDHLAHLADTVETLREMANNLSGLYMSVMSNRMNETMRILTIMASLFIPMTFLAGVYGMNFEYMPELAKPWAYPAFWVICLVVTGALLRFFHKRGWLDGIATRGI